MSRITVVRTHTGRGLLLALAFLAGCSNSLPPEADSEKARSALETALGAWKKGDKPDSLRGGSPAIYLNEPQWVQGRTLVEYKIEPGSETRLGQGVCYTVSMTVEDDKGQKNQRKVVYQIHTGKAIVIAPPG